MTKEQILQDVQNAIDNGATVIIGNGAFVITHSDGTVERIDAPFLNEIVIPTEGGEIALGC